MFNVFLGVYMSHAGTKMVKKKVFFFLSLSLLAVSLQYKKHPKVETTKVCLNEKTSRNLYKERR